MRGRALCTGALSSWSACEPLANHHALWPVAQVVPDADRAALDTGDVIRDAAGASAGTAMAGEDREGDAAAGAAPNGAPGSGDAMAELVELENTGTRPPAGTLLIVRDLGSNL